MIFSALPQSQQQNKPGIGRTLQSLEPQLSITSAIGYGDMKPADKKLWQKQLKASFQLMGQGERFIMVEKT